MEAFLPQTIVGRDSASAEELAALVEFDVLPRFVRAYKFALSMPSDMSGITTITYRYENNQDVAALMAPACDNLRNHILKLGPFNG